MAQAAAQLARQIFQNEEVRIFGTIKDPLFVANDIGKLLDMKNIHKVISDLEDYQKSGLTISDPHGRLQLTTVLTESGLCEVIFKSRKPIAKEFKRRIYSEVIPSLRRDGRYEVPVEALRPAQPAPQMIGPIAPPVAQLTLQEVDELLALHQQVEHPKEPKPVIPYHPCDINDYIDDPCIYLFYLKDNDYKYGKSGEIDVRSGTHERDFRKHGCVIQLVKLWSCSSMGIMNKVERMIKGYARQRGIAAEKYGYTEILTTADIGPVVLTIDKYVTKRNAAHDSPMKIQMMQLELESKRLEVELKRIDLERLRLELQAQPSERAPQITINEPPALPATAPIVHHAHHAHPVNNVINTPVVDDRLTTAREWVHDHPPEGKFPKEYYNQYKGEIRNHVKTQVLTELITSLGYRRCKIGAPRKCTWVST